MSVSAPNQHVSRHADLSTFWTLSECSIESRKSERRPNPAAELKCRSHLEPDPLHSDSLLIHDISTLDKHMSLVTELINK